MNVNLRCDTPTDTGEACARRGGHTGGHRPMPGLAEMFAFEARTSGPGRAAAIDAEFGIHPVRYQQFLNQALDTREALELDPILTRRLLARRDHNRRT